MEKYLQESMVLKIQSKEFKMENHNRNKELESFLRDDYDFSQYLHNRNEDESDFSDIFNAVKSGDITKIPEEKKILNEFMKSPDADIQEIIKMGQNPDPILKYASTKILLKTYDNLIKGGMKKQHEIEKKNNPTAEESSNLDKTLQRGFKMAMELAKIMQRTDLKEEFNAMVEISNACKTANEGTNQSLIPTDMLVKISKDRKSMLSKILQMAGRFQKSFAHKINTKTDGYDSVIGVEFGDDVENVLPEEIAMMDNLELGELKSLDFLQGNLMQYKYIGKKPMTGGALICCIDESGSMMQFDNIIKAKAYCFGLWQQAKAENREFAIVRFGYTGHAETVKIKNLSDMITMSESFFDDGGTDFETPLTHCINIINSSIKHNNSDIIMITDGASTMSDSYIAKFNEYKNQTQTKLIVLDVSGMSKYYGNLSQVASVIVNDYDTLIMQS